MRSAGSIAAIAMMIAVLPATAQEQDGGARQPAGPSIEREVGRIDRTIRAGQRGGQLSKREARSLRREADQIDVLADRYRAGGTSASERRELDTRVAVLRAQVHARRTLPTR